MPTGVLLMTYGSPRDLDDVGAYMARVRGGREPDATLLAEFRRRYAAIGMSPLIDITRAQARALEIALGDDVRVAAGMRFSEPSVAAAVADVISRGADRLIGLILSPQYSPILMSGYVTALRDAAGGLPWRCIEAWHLSPAFIDVLASRVRRALAAYSDARRERVAVLLTAHSLPLRVVDREPAYVEQLKATARLVASAAGLPDTRWWFAYQSAGHSPEPWLKPDLLDVLPRLAAEGYRDVLVAPVQFLADHLETLYDIDLAARDQALAAGFERFARVEAPNAAPDFIDALASIVRAELVFWDQAAAGPVWVGA
ncbi:MAG TPA: ferrochelatase [Chloroflexota bacterium]